MMEVSESLADEIVGMCNGWFENAKYTGNSLCSFRLSKECNEVVESMCTKIPLKGVE